MTFDKAAFYAEIRKPKPEGFGPLKQGQIDGIEAILDRCVSLELPLAHTSYVLATPWHETKTTMQPVEEAYYIKNAEAWRKAHLRYYPWYGRGLVQLTWKVNYAHADAECAKAGLIKPGEILANPNLLLRMDISVYVLCVGMRDGWFTGAALHNMLPSAGVATRAQYMQARTIINGKDDADLIEDYAQIFERGLRHGGYQ